MAVDYFGFEKMICNALEIRLPQFQIETVKVPAFQAVIPARTDIPENLQLTVAQVLRMLKGDP